MNLFPKLFWRMALPFSIGMGVVFFLQHGFPACLVGGVLAGVFYGVIMAMFGAFTHKRAVSNMPYGVTEETLDIQHVRNIDLDMPYDRAFNLCLSCLYLMDGVMVQRENRPTGEILAKTSLGWKTWGDRIAINIMK